MDDGAIDEHQGACRDDNFPEEGVVTESFFDVCRLDVVCLRVVQLSKLGAEPLFHVLDKPLLQWELLGARNELQTAVFDRAVLQGKPEAHTGDRVGVEELCVVVGRHLCSDVRLFDDAHALDSLGVPQPQLSADGGHVVRDGHRVELVVEEVQAVADLVDRLAHGDLELVRVVRDGLRLEEVVDFV